MIWYKRSEDLPLVHGERVLCYSPVYKNRDVTMLYRILDSQFISMCEDVDYWAYIEEPEMKGD